MGYWSYAELKSYGVSKDRPPTHRELIKAERRSHAIDSIMDNLKDWRCSPFEYESACVAGIRSALCMQGHRWALADLEARALVGEALRRIGAKRPTWEEGQREYSVPHENCQWCGIVMPDEAKEGNRNYRFCSAVCAQSALRHREYETAWYRDSKAWSAYRMVLREKAEARTCKHCGSIFKPVRDAAQTEYCSMRCHQQHRRIIPDRECEQCGIVFKPRNSSIPGRFCSRRCHQAHVDSRRIESHCDYCGKMFFAKQPDAHFCCGQHYKQYRKVSLKIRDMQLTGRAYRPRGPEAHFAQRMVDAAMAGSNVIYLTPAIFDQWFRKAA